MPLDWSSFGVFRSGLWPGELLGLQTAATRAAKTMG
jgi:hypothetical protein